MARGLIGLRPILDFCWSDRHNAMQTRSTRSFCSLSAAAVILAPSLAAKDAGKTLYFPPAGADWAIVTPQDSGWDFAKLKAALKFAGERNSSGVVALWRGRILAEQYWDLKGKNGVSLRYFGGVRGRDSAGHVIEDVASVQKSVTAVLVGVARDRGLIEVAKPVSEYLGKGWSQATPAQEGTITVRHLMTMSSGLTEKLSYQGPAGKRWHYNTTAYSRTRDILVKVSGQSANELTRNWLTGRMGMKDSQWTQRPGAKRDPQQNQLGFATTARDLARFGLLVLAQGEWDGATLVQDKDYLKMMLRPSQKLNPAYGYLWWLNGQKRLARGQRPASTSMLPAAPNDLVVASGALGRKLWVVPSLDLVVTRLGDTPGPRFDNQFWTRLMAAAPKK